MIEIGLLSERSIIRVMESGLRGVYIYIIYPPHTHTGRSKDMGFTCKVCKRKCRNWGDRVGNNVYSELWMSNCYEFEICDECGEKRGGIFLKYRGERERYLRGKERKMREELGI